MFFLVPAHLGSPRQRAVKWSCVCVLAVSQCYSSCFCCVEPRGSRRQRERQAAWSLRQEGRSEYQQEPADAVESHSDAMRKKRQSIVSITKDHVRLDSCRSEKTGKVSGMVHCRRCLEYQRSYSTLSPDSTEMGDHIPSILAN